MESADTSVARKGQELIARLYQIIDAYEVDPTTLVADAFMDLYSRVERAIELSGESESQAYNLDQALFNSISLGEIDTSDLRIVVSNALSIHHRYHADYGRGFEQAYRWCEHSRVQSLPDLRYIHAYLLPILIQPDAMGGIQEVNLFLVERLGRFENLEKSPIWDDDGASELLKQEPADIVYQLARRRVMYVAENLIKVPGSLEQTLFKDGEFKKLIDGHGDMLPLMTFQIELYGYMHGEPWWRRLGQLTTQLFGGIVERMAGDYLAYELTRRKGAYIFQGLLMVLIVLGLFMGVFGWAWYSSHDRLGQIEDDLEIVDDLLQADETQLRIDADLLRADLEER